MRRAVLLALFVACSPANPPPETVKPPVALAPEAGVSLGFQSPASWSLELSQRWRSSASLALDSGSTLEVGEGGERWIESVSGESQGAASLAPEPLVGILKTSNGYRFVGASGSVYSAREALGALTVENKSSLGARRVAVGKRAILLVDAQGDLHRSIDAGRTWTKVDIAGRDGVIVDVAMLGDGGILVTAPQRFFGTKDDGATWTAVKSPGIGVQDVVARDNALWVEGVEDTMWFDPAWGTFHAGARSHTTRRPIPNAPREIVRRIDGRRAAELVGTAKERAWTLATGEVGALGRPRKVDELDGCEMVDLAMRGDDLVLACDARGTVAGGIDKDASSTIPSYYRYGKSGPHTAHAAAPDGGSLGWITRILRSSDGGRTFHEDTTIEGGIPQRGDAALAIGAEDFVYLGRRCGMGYAAPCLPARARASKSAGFSEVPEIDGADAQLRFATNTVQSLTYSIGTHDNEAVLFRWKSGAAIPETIGRIATSADRDSATITLDDDGTVRGFVRASGTPTVFTYREGGTIATMPIHVAATHAAFAEKHGLAVGNDGHGKLLAWESLDGGKTWGGVPAPAYLAKVEACSSFGCETDRGVRWGWDAPAGTSDGATGGAVTAIASYARPLRCVAKDRWIALGGGNLPTIDDVDHGAARWVLPVRDKSGKIALLVSKRGEPTTKTSSVALMGAPPGPPTFGSGTVVHVQPDGVVAVRYVYKRARSGLGRYNPVDAQLVWYRDATGKIFRGAVSKNPPFRVSRDPQDGYARDAQPPFTELPEIVALGPKGVYFHPPTTFVDQDDSSGEPKRWPLMFVHDDGKVDKIAYPEALDDSNGTAYAASVDGTATIFGRNPESMIAVTVPDGHKTFFSVLGGLGDDDGAVDLVSLGGKPAFAATLRDPARAWLLPLKSDPDLGAATAIPTQKSLGEMPKACDGAMTTDPNAYRVNATWVMGSRRPVVVDADGVAVILATDRAEIRGAVSATSKTDGCVAAFDATAPSQDGDDDYGALVFPDDLAHSLLFRAETTSWPAQIAVRAMECQYQAGPLPEELQQVEGFTPETRHAALRKRY